MSSSSSSINTFRNTPIPRRSSTFSSTSGGETAVESDSEPQPSSPRSRALWIAHLNNKNEIQGIKKGFEHTLATLSSDLTNKSADQSLYTNTRERSLTSRSEFNNSRRRTRTGSYTPSPTRIAPAAAQGQSIVSKKLFSMLSIPVLFVIFYFLIENKLKNLEKKQSLAFQTLGDKGEGNAVKLLERIDQVEEKVGVVQTSTKNDILNQLLVDTIKIDSDLTLMPNDKSTNFVVFEKPGLKLMLPASENVSPQAKFVFFNQFKEASAKNEPCVIKVMHGSKDTIKQAGSPDKNSINFYPGDNLELVNIGTKIWQVQRRPGALEEKLESSTPYGSAAKEFIGWLKNA